MSMQEVYSSLKDYMKRLDEWIILWETYEATDHRDEERKETAINILKKIKEELTEILIRR